MGLKHKYFSDDPVNPDAVYHAGIVRWFVILALIGGMLIILLSPPFTCPDENCHYVNICRIVEGSFFPNVENNEVGCYITVDQNNFLGSFYGKYDGVSAPKFTFWDAYFQGFLEFNNEKELFYSTRLATINPVSYIIPALGASLAKNVFGINNPYVMLMFAKLFNLFLYVALTALAIKKTPILKRTMLLISLMPMTLYQCASTSYDALIIPCAFLLFAYLAKILLSDADYRVSAEDAIAISLSCVGIFAAKVAYAPLVIILLTIPFKKFNGIKKYVTCIASVVSVAIAFYLIPTVICNGISSGCTNTTWEIIDQQKAHFMSNIFVIFPVLKNTISESFGFWATGFFGVLGNLDTQFPPMFIILYYVTLTATAAVELCMIRKISLSTRILSALACIIFFVGTIASMYISWTPLVTGTVGGETSTGFQGRYFIPITLFALLAFANPVLVRFKYRDNINAISLEITKFITLLYVILTSVIMLLRFWI